MTTMQGITSYATSLWVHVSVECFRKHIFRKMFNHLLGQKRIFEGQATMNTTGNYLGWTQVGHNWTPTGYFSVSKNPSTLQFDWQIISVHKDLQSRKELQNEKELTASLEFHGLQGSLFASSTNSCFRLRKDTRNIKPACGFFYSLPCHLPCFHHLTQFHLDQKNRNHKHQYSSSSPSQ